MGREQIGDVAVDPGAGVAGGECLGGERIYASDLVVRRMAGDMYDELEPIG